MQVSPSGMAAASQAVPGEFDSRHLLQVSIIRTIYKSRVNGSDSLFIWINKRMLTLILRYSVASLLTDYLFILKKTGIDFPSLRLFNFQETHFKSGREYKRLFALSEIDFDVLLRFVDTKDFPFAKLLMDNGCTCDNSR